MIAHPTVDLKSLPSFPLSWKKALPKTPGIYFAIDADETIQYIGMSKNINTRWFANHRYSELLEIEGMRLAWLEVSDEKLLPHIERALIQYFKPKLNQTNVREKKKSSGELHPNSLKNLYKPPRTITPNEACAKRPVQVRVAESEYEEWIKLPVEVRNKALRETISNTIKTFKKEDLQTA